METREKWILAALVAVLVASVPSIRFRLVHPCLTDTELLMHTWDAMMWRTLDVCKK